MGGTAGEPPVGSQVIRAEPGSTVYAVLHGDIHIRNGYPVYLVMPYPLDARAIPAGRARRQPSRLLAADAQVVPFAGRSGELAELAVWRDDPQPGVSVMLVHAPGGQGKTRLAARFAADSADEGWTAWAARHLSDPAGEHVVAPGDPGRLLVLIVDYAERWPVDDLTLLLENPLFRRPERCRVLLIARQAGTWWPSLRHRLDKAGVSVGPTLALPPLAGTVPERHEAFTSARDAFGALLGVATASIGIPSALNGDAFGLVLTIHMAALVAVDAHQRGQPSPTDPVALSGYLLDREQDFWHTLHDHQQVSTAPAVMGRAVYTATLTHPLHHDQAVTALGRARVADVSAAGAVLDDHARCYPPTAEAGTALEPLNPDRLGEDFLALTTPGHTHPDYSPDPWALQTPARLLSPDQAAPPPYARPALTAMVETARRWPHIARHQLYPLLHDHPQLALAAGGTTLAGIAERSDISIALLEAIEAHLPQERHTDLDTGIAVLARRLAEHQLSVTTEPDQRAAIFHTLGVRLARAGLTQEAADATSQAVRLYCQLADADPGIERSSAEAMLNLSISLSDLGRSDEALSASGDAVQILRRLARSEPEEFTISLVTALNSHAAHLTDRGHREEASAAVAEAVAICQELPEAALGATDDTLAMTLHNFAVSQADLGQREEALSAAELAVRAYRTLAASSPETHQPDLARALTTLAARFSGLGRPEEALFATQEAVRLWRELTRANQTLYEASLAETLSNQAVVLTDLGRREEALAANQEAAEIFMRLAEANPLAFEPGMATMLHNLGKRLADLGRLDEALAATRQAADMRRRLAVTNPAAAAPDLADSLQNLGIRLAALGHREEALVITEEAAGVYRRLAAATPAIFQPGLAAVLNNLAIRQSGVGRREEALGTAQEAADTYRQLANEWPTVFEPDLAMALNNLANRLANLGQHSEALAASQEAVEVYRHLAGTRPEAFEPELAASLGTLGHRFADLGRREDALASAQEATAIARRLAAVSPEAFEPNLGRSLIDLSPRLSVVGRKGEATNVAEEAVALYRRLAQSNPAAFTSELAAALNNLAILLSAQGRRDDAVSAGKEATGIYRQLAMVNPGAFESEVARSLMAVASQQVLSLSAQADAFKTIQESVAIYQRLAAQRPQVFTEDLRAALRVASATLADTGHGRDAATLKQLISSRGLDVAAQELKKMRGKGVHPVRRLGASAIRRSGKYHGAVAQAFIERARRHGGHGRYDAAVTELNRAIYLDPANSEALGMRGSAYLFMGQAKNAAADLTRAIELDPESAHLYFARGEAYRAMERYEDVVTDFIKALKLDPSLGEAIDLPVGPMFSTFTDRARRVMVLAREEARTLNHEYIGTEHILLGLIREGEGVAAVSLKSLGISLKVARQQVEEITGHGQQEPTVQIPFTDRAKNALKLSQLEAMLLGHHYVGTEHLLLGLIREGEGVAVQVLVSHGAHLETARQEVARILGS